jgi:hypothetical protein
VQNNSKTQDLALFQEGLLMSMLKTLRAVVKKIDSVSAGW